ncbi:dienelactone hydrolase family protein [Okibacterium endophyticum]
MHRIAIDDDAVIWSARAPERAGRPLLIVMHGYGSHEGDLFGLAPHLPLEPVIASLRAPLLAPWPVDGWSWFQRREPGEPDLEDLDRSASAVIDWIDSLEVTPASIGLLGFSQGGAMVLHLMRTAPDRFAYGVNLAGFITSRQMEGDETLAERRPPVFWGRGAVDDVIPETDVAATTEWLPSHSTLTGRIYEGLGHAINEQELSDIHGFVARQLSTR